jgi:hypothetical protein
MLTPVVLASEVVNELPMPAWAFGVVFLVGFFALALVTYSYRNVANRHSQKRASHSGGHH